jgi:hypothetical protein
MPAWLNTSASQKVLHLHDAAKLLAGRSAKPSRHQLFTLKFRFEEALKAYEAAVT